VVVMTVVSVATVFTAMMMAIATAVMFRTGISHRKSHQSGDTGKHQKLGKPGDLLKDANFVF